MKIRIIIIITDSRWKSFFKHKCFQVFFKRVPRRIIANFGWKTVPHPRTSSRESSISIACPWSRNVKKTRCDWSQTTTTWKIGDASDQLRALNLPLKIYNWIADFLTGRSQCVKLQTICSALAAISRSVVPRFQNRAVFIHTSCQKIKNYFFS